MGDVFIVSEEPLCWLGRMFPGVEGNDGPTERSYG